MQRPQGMRQQPLNRNRHHHARLQAAKVTVVHSDLPVHYEPQGSTAALAEDVETTDKHTLQGFAAINTKVDAVIYTHEHSSHRDLPRPVL